TTRRRQIRVVYEDPAGIDVNDVRSRVQWTYEDNCTTAGSRSPYWDWFEQSGWRRETYSSAGEKDCTYGMTSVVTAQFINDSFCPTGNVHTRFDPVYYQGRSDGNGYWEQNVDKYGAYCHNFLSKNVTIGSW
ncbi:MAG: hypothetical protein M3Q82_09105, partial [Actinomycetota bacterium]|nr:hypothetical protein [Actinomycetota bacterium]